MVTCPSGGGVTDQGAGVIKVEQAQKSWVAKAWALPRKLLTGGIVQVKQRYKQLKNRYGPRYTHAMLIAVFLTFFLPIPGSVLAAVALIVVIAEIHRTISKRRQRAGGPRHSVNGAAGTSPKELVMPINCDVILQWSATPEQLTVLGAAFWRWCNRAAEATGIYQFLDNQALADLIAGKLPTPSQTLRPAGRRGVHFWVSDEASHDRQATVDRLRREIPARGVEDIVVDGTSWNLVESKDETSATLQRLTRADHIRFISNQQPRLEVEANKGADDRRL